MAPKFDPEIDAVVSARSILWLGDLTKQQKSDVIDSTLFAQLAADKQYDSNDIDNWYRQYTDVLGVAGWTIQKSGFTAVQYNKASGSVDDTVITTLGGDPKVTKETLAAISELFIALTRSGKESHANQVLNASSIASNHQFASFQLGVASNDNGVLVLSLYAFTHSSSLKIHDAVWFHWKNATMHFQTSTLTMSLNEDVYSRARADIAQKLEGRKHVVVALK